MLLLISQMMIRRGGGKILLLWRGEEFLGKLMGDSVVEWGVAVRKGFMG